MKSKIITITILMFVLLVGISGCSSKNAECKVTYDRDGNLEFIINPPGEEGEKTTDGSWTRSSEISVPGPSITTYTGTLEVRYADSGNLYIVDMDVTIENDRLTAYQLVVTGGVYGEEPHICSRP